MHGHESVTKTVMNNFVGSNIVRVTLSAFEKIFKILNGQLSTFSIEVTYILSSIPPLDFSFRNEE